MRFFVPSFFYQSVHSGPIRDVHGPFYFFLLFHRVIALLKQLPGTLETREFQLPDTLDTGESCIPGIQRAEELLFFYLDLDIGLHGSIFKQSI